MPVEITKYSDRQRVEDGESSPCEPPTNTNILMPTKLALYFVLMVWRGIAIETVSYVVGSLQEQRIMASLQSIVECGQWLLLP
jgi:hypothetical protein